MSRQWDAGLPPELWPIVDRAHRYRDEVYATTGQMPERFLVTADEYRQLRMYDSHRPFMVHRARAANDVLLLCGMRVITPERMAWYRDNTYMDHIRISALLPRPLHEWEPLPSVAEQLGHCRTERLPRPQREIACPCGEVLWDLSMCIWDVARMNDERTVARRIRSADHGESMETPESALPDETLTCCGRTWSTHAAWMAHYREAHG
jgi:hypothetical protein